MSSLNDLVASFELKLSDHYDKPTTLFDHQVEAGQYAYDHGGQARLCLYYRTGAGKTVASLLAIRAAGHDKALVLAPLITRDEWATMGRLLGVDVEVITHEKFRQPNYKLLRGRAVIVDEFHRLGGHGGKGWQKFDRLCRGITAPIVILSATPNYNDAERVYCVMHAMDPASVSGGYPQFLYEHCLTEENPFSMIPNVRGFRNHKDAEAFLVSLPFVIRVEETHRADDFISDIYYAAKLPESMTKWRVDLMEQRVIASEMEMRHVAARYALIDQSTGRIRPHVWSELENLVGNVLTPSLVFSASKTIAEVMFKTAMQEGASVDIITGDTDAAARRKILEDFKQGETDVLIGTAAMATGTDGLDKVCDQLIILHDTDDDALRRQLIGRILPRGGDTDASRKLVPRLVPDWGLAATP